MISSLDLRKNIASTPVKKIKENLLFVSQNGKIRRENASRSEGLASGLSAKLFDFDDHFFPVAGQNTTVAPERLVEFLFAGVD